MSLEWTLIEGENDSDEELQALTRWVVEQLGPDVPLHFSAFHPDFKMTDRPSTPGATLTPRRRQRSSSRRTGAGVESGRASRSGSSFTRRR